MKEGKSLLHNGFHTHIKWLIVLSTRRGTVLLTFLTIVEFIGGLPWNLFPNGFYKNDSEARGQNFLCTLVTTWKEFVFSPMYQEDNQPKHLAKAVPF